MKDENFLIEVHDRFMKTELCNSYIKSAFSGYLLLLDYRKLDPGDIFTLTDSWCFKIKSKNNDSIQLILDFWKYQVNIYVGDEEVQYSDDASVRTEKQQDRFRKALKTLFHSFVVEKNL